MSESESLQAAVESIRKITVVPTILEVIARTTGMGFAAVAYVTDTRWVACAVQDEIAFGLKPGGELELVTTICNEIRQSGHEVVIDHVAADPVFCGHHTPKQYGFQSYISVPIILPGGEFFGTLCAIDPKPAKLNNPTVLGMFRLYAELIATHLQGMKDMHAIESRLTEERKMARWREQFIAMLGHDLRSPLTAIDGSAQLLLRLAQDKDTKQLAAIIKNSVTRMNGLIADVYDFARGKLGNGMIVSRTTARTIEEVLTQVITEQSTVAPNARITTDYRLDQAVCFDPLRMAQLFSNVLGNAIKYGDPAQPIKITAYSHDGRFSFSVTNAGQKIPPAVLEHIFEPFSRGASQPGQHGLGLGLFISSEIARAHGGVLSVDSGDTHTTFTLTMPCE